MAWISKYVVYRPDENTQTLDEVFRCEQIKKANYWIKYIAQVDDALFTTPLHNNNQGGEKPKYFSHKSSSGQGSSDGDEWGKRFGTYKMPSEQTPE